MNISTLLLAHVADCSEGQDKTPGLWGIAMLVLSAATPSLEVKGQQVELAIKELASMGKNYLAERLCQVAR